MSEENERIERLEHEMRQLRGWILVLGIALVATFALGATQGTPDELTLRRLAIVDADGKERIVASTRPDGWASIQHFDPDGKARIVAAPGPVWVRSNQAVQRFHVATGSPRRAALRNAAK